MDVVREDMQMVGQREENADAGKMWDNYSFWKKFDKAKRRRRRLISKILVTFDLGMEMSEA